jgi:hypothetical protein
VDRKVIVSAACDCAELALVHVSADEDRPRIAIETARRWVRGEATLKEVRAAAAASTSVYSTSAYSAYSASAYSASAAAAATSATSAANAVAYAAYAAYAAYSAARRTVRQKCAEIVRRHIPWRVVSDALGKQVLS